MHYGVTRCMELLSYQIRITISVRLMALAERYFFVVSTTRIEITYSDLKMHQVIYCGFSDDITISIIN